MAQYKVGTVSVTNGSATVSGTGTEWAVALNNIKAGDIFVPVGDTTGYVVQSVTNNTTLVLTGAITRSTATGLNYVITRDFTANLSLPLFGTGDTQTGKIFNQAMNRLDVTFSSGTVNPIFNNITVNGNLILDADADTYITSPSDDIIDVYTAGNLRSRLDGSGNTQLGGTDSFGGHRLVLSSTGLHLGLYETDATVNNRLWTFQANGELFQLQARTDAGGFISNAFNITRSGQLQSLLGNAAAPVYSFASDPDTGVFRATTNELGLATAGIERMRIDSTGNLGLGTTDPNTRLHVFGSQLSGGIFVEDSNSASAAPSIRVRGERSDSNASAAFSGKFVAERFNSGGTLGLSTTLGVVIFGGNHTSGLSSNIAYSASISAVAEGLFNSASDMPTGLAFCTGSVGQSSVDTANVNFGTEVMRISANGRVGIGVTGPARTLHVLGGVRIEGLPTSPTGLSSGDLWTDGGTLKVA